MNPYNYSDYLKRNRVKYYLLLVPVAVLLAAAVYIFFIYDPNPSKDTNNGASMTLEEPKKIEDSPEVETTTAADADEFKMAPVTLTPAVESIDEASLSEDNQVEAAASDEKSSSEIAIFEEAESAEKVLSAVDDNTTEETPEKSPEETTLSVSDDESTQETTLSATDGDSTEEAIISAGVDEPIEEAAAAATVEEPIEDSFTEDATAKRVSYVETDSADSLQGAKSVAYVETESIDSPQAVSSALDYSRKAAAQVEEKQSQSVVADELQQLSGGYIERKAVITSSLSQATSDAGLSANQSARIGKIFKPYLDSSRELRKGDELTIFLDPAAATTGNDAEQIHRVEFHGARKSLVVTRKEGSLSDYEVRSADGKMLRGEVSTTSIVVEKPRREASVAPPASRSVADYNAVTTGSMKRIEGVVTVTIFSAARDAGLNAGQLKKLEEILNPYINFNKDVRKGDRIVIMLDGSDIYSSEFNGAVKKLAVVRGDDGTYREVKPGDTDINSGESGDDNSNTRKPPFWKRWFGSKDSSED
jgi:hypothetical protein